MGGCLGDAHLDLDASALGTSTSRQGNLFYFELHGVVGVRMNFRFGLSLRAEGVFSTYGGFLAFQPNLGVAYTWQ